LRDRFWYTCFELDMRMLKFGEDPNMVTEIESVLRLSM